MNKEKMHFPEREGVGLNPDMYNDKYCHCPEPLVDENMKCKYCGGERKEEFKIKKKKK